jgi:hypothetical protein
LVTRALDRAVLAVRCLDGAAAELAAYVSRGGQLGDLTADRVPSEAAKLDELAAEIARVEGS